MAALSNPGQNCWYLSLSSRHWALSHCRYALTLTHPGDISPLRPLTHPQGGYVSTLRVYKPACQSATLKMSDGIEGRMAGWAHGGGVKSVSESEEDKIDLRKMKNHETDVEKMGRDDKWEEAAGRKMEQLTKGQKTRRKQRVLRWGQREKTPLCARVVPYHPARAKQQSLNILTLNNITSSDSNCSVSCCLALPL